MTISGGIFVLQQVYNKQVAKTWPAKSPAISPPITNISSVNEGSSVIINVNTFDYEGQTLYWTIQGVTGTINSSDFTNFSGSFTVQANNFGTFTITTTEDLTTEGTESFVVQIRTDSTSGSIKATSDTITINDTSLSIPESYGWFGGGTESSSIERYSHINDTTNTEVRNNLSKSVRAFYATNNSDYGWFAGGLRISTPTAVVSDVERLTFVSDTTSLSIRGNLSHVLNDGAASGNQNYGWHAGGSDGTTTPKSSIQRIDYSADTSTSLTRGRLNTTVERNGGTGNDNYGWFFGGLVDPFVPSPSLQWLSRIERIIYSSDTSTASLRGPLDVIRVQARAVSTTNYGWIAGGRNPPNSNQLVTSICRIDFNSDTQTTPVRSNLTSGSQGMSYTNNSTYGWFTLGATSSGINRIEFLNDTVNAIQRAFTQSGKSLTASATGSI
jgi:hypothetical protein